MRVYIIRHGSTVFTEQGRLQGLRDVPLSTAGRDEIKRLADRLAKYPLAKIYSSPLQRTRETALLLAAPHGLAPRCLPFLREFSWGPAEGLTPQEMQERFPCLFRFSGERLPAAVPGGESSRRLRSRAKLLERFLLRKSALDEQQSVAIVSHGRFLQAFLTRALNLPGSTRPFILFPASLSVLEIRSPQNRLLLLNDTAHLPRSAFPV
jgi:broad specificity phosphatase PhoE